MIDLSNVEALRSFDDSFSLRSGVDSGGQRWLEYIVSEAQEQTVYALVGVSDQRYQELLNSRLPLRDVFEKAESGKVYRVVRYWEEKAPDKKAYVEAVGVSTLEERFQKLPEPGRYFNRDTTMLKLFRRVIHPLLPDTVGDDYEDRLRTLDPIYEEVLQHLAPSGVGRNNLILAGGAVRDTLTGHVPKDYDFFIAGGPIRAGRIARLTGNSSKQFVLRLREAIRQEGGNFRYSDVRSLLELRSAKLSRPTRLMVGNLCYTGGCASLKNDKEIQIILYNYAETVEDLLDGFDIDICAYGYSPNRGLIRVDQSPSLLLLQRKMIGAIPVEINPTGCMAKVITQRRLERFEKRFGCDVKAAKKQLEQLPVPGGHFPYRYGKRIWPVPQMCLEE